jgi:hypothetical protein
MNNEYTNSAHISQFTFGPGPDSRISEFGMTGTTSANKSVSKENILYTMNDITKNKKIKPKQKKSSNKHLRTDSKNSKKGKKHSKKKSNSKHTASLNGYYIAPTKPKIENKSRNNMYQSSSSSQYDNNLRSADMFKSGITPSHHSSLFGKGKIPNESAFLTKMTTKSKNSRNDGLFKISTGTNKQMKSDMVLNILGSQKVNFNFNIL